MQTSRCQCPTCKFAFRVEERFLGRVANCPKCTQRIRLADNDSGAGADPAVNSDPSNPFISTPSAGQAPRDYLTQSDPDVPGLDPLADRAAAKRAARRVVRTKLKQAAPVTEQAVKKKQDLGLKLLGIGIALSCGLFCWGIYVFAFTETVEPEVAAEWVDPNEAQFQALQTDQTPPVSDSSESTPAVESAARLTSLGAAPAATLSVTAGAPQQPDAFAADDLKKN